MSSVTSATSSAYTAADAANTTSRLPQKTLGQEDFLKLITVQMTKQDPMKPMEDTSFIAQMAQFTSLEQTNNLVKEFGLMRSSADLSAASSLIGTQVTLQDSSGTETVGVVTAIDNNSSSPRLVVNGTAYPFANLKRVELPVLDSAS